MNKQFLLYEGKCPVCGSTNSQYQHITTRDYCSEKPKFPSFFYAHPVFFHVCNDCGTRTAIETLPMITDIEME